jgi:hypothetical protein
MTMRLIFETKMGPYDHEVVFLNQDGFLMLELELLGWN